MKRVLLLTDEELDRVLAWFELSEPLRDPDDEDDEEIAAKVRAARLA